MPLPLRALPAGFIAPCLPSSAPQPPSGEAWLHEIKHDGFRIIARKEGKQVKLYSRPGNDLTERFPLIVETLARLRSRSCIIDGEAVACGEDGIASFDCIRYRRNDRRVFLYAFDLIELDGDDLRATRWPCARRHLRAYCQLRRRACASTSTWTRGTARSYSRTPASSGWKELCRSVRTLVIARGAHRTGSRARTRMHRP
jgi:ATP-dependent DNA ligase